MRSIVHLPITGYVQVEVIHEEGLTGDQVVTIAMDQDPGSPEEWGTHRIIAQGNVCYALLNEAVIMATIEDDEDENGDS